MIASVIKPKRPTGHGWEQQPLPPAFAVYVAAMGGFPTEIWIHYGADLQVISAIEVAKDPGQPELGPEYHFSISAMGMRCTAEQATWAKEDNHVPSGKVRNFWRPVADHLSGYECPCVDDEPAVREDKGSFVWRGVTE